MEMKKRVAIIGAGTSGLTAIKCCLDEGLEPVCYEKTKDIGGIWNFRESKQFKDFNMPTVFRSTVTNTSKEIMAFSDFPPPPEFPIYMKNTYVNQYLNLYADKFNLKRHIIFNVDVKLAHPSDDYDSSGRWALNLEDQDGRHWTETFDAVLVCNGHHGTPNMPDFPGMEEFEGNIIHTRDYRRPNGYQDKRVVVIGIGNSACDAATDLAKVTSKLYLSTREGAWVLFRLHNSGLPTDMGIRRVGLIAPKWLVEWNVKRLINSKLDHTIYSLKTKHSLLAKPFTVNDELQYHIVNGNIVIKPNIKRFTKSGVQFDDGSYEDIDSVILGTGYDITVPVDSSLVDVSRNAVNLYRNVFPPDLKHPTLAVIGLTSQAGPQNPICEMQCRWATRLIKGICKLPTKVEMKHHIKEHNRGTNNNSTNASRNPIFVNYIPYLDEIANEIDVKPRLGRLLFRDPLLAIKCYFGAMLPYQYRLMGPGKWDGAKVAIETVWDRVFGAYHTREVPEDEVSVFTAILKIVIVIVIIMVIIMVLAPDILVLT